MKKVIRLTESDLTRLVKRVIQESAAQNVLNNIDPNIIEKVKNKLKCYNPYEYPTIQQAARGQLMLAAGLLVIYVAAGGEVLSFGTLTIPAFVTGAFGGYTVGKGIIELKGVNIEQIKKELEKFRKCVGI